MRRSFVISVVLLFFLAAGLPCGGEEFQRSPVRQFTKSDDAAGNKTAQDVKKEPSPGLATKYYKVKNYQASFLAGTVKLLLSSNGTIQSNDDLNVIVINDAEDNIRQIVSLLEEVDTLPQQIVIEAMVLEVRNDASKDSGINIATIFERASLGESFSKSLNERKDYANTSENNNNSFSWNTQLYGRIDYSPLSKLINFLVENNYAKIMAEPKIVTINNKTGRVFIGNKVKIISTYEYNGIGFNTRSDQTATEEAGLLLEVTPHIGESNFITMDIKTGFGELAELTSSSINTFKREANSTIIVKSGEPIVLGGYKTQETNSTRYKFPVLGSLPILKSFFSKKEKTTEDVELVLILTPRIVAAGAGIKSELADEAEASAEK